jgi:predicted nucleic acid-binding Zn ribbon protein
MIKFKKSQMQSLGGIMHSSFKKRITLTTQVQAGLVVEFINNLILEFWGKKGKEQAKATVFKNKIVTIITKNSLMAQEIKFKQNKILLTVNEHFGYKTINQLRIVAGGIDKKEENA